MKIQYKVFCLWLLVAIGFTSCTIETNTHFEKDYSGSLQTEVDFNNSRTFLKNMFGDEGEKMIDSMVVMLKQQNESGGMNSQFAELGEELAKKGIQNLKMNATDADGLFFSFDFDNIKAISDMSLDKALTEDIGLAKSDVDRKGQMNSNDLITVNGKWMTIDFSADGVSELAKEMEGEEQIGMLEQFQELFGNQIIIKQSYSFARKIKKVETPFEYKMDKNKITIQYTTLDILNMVKKGEKPILKIKLK